MSWSGARQHRPNKQQLSAQRSALEAPQRTRSRTYTQRRRARARPAPAGAGGESNSRRGPAQISHVLYVNAYVLRYVRRRQNRAQTITQGTGSRRILRVRATVVRVYVGGRNARWCPATTVRATQQLTTVVQPSPGRSVLYLVPVLLTTHGSDLMRLLGSGYFLALLLLAQGDAAVESLAGGDAP